MPHGSFPPSPFASLLWLADLIPGAGLEVVLRDCGSTPAVAVASATRSLGCRRDLARELGCGESLGVDMVNATVNELLARGALPSHAALHIIAARDAELPVAITAGIARACRSQELAIVVPLAALGEEPERVGLLLTGGVIAPPSVAPAPGDVVLALRGSGPSNGDFAALVAHAQQIGLGLGDRLASGDTVGAVLLAPQKSHLCVLQQPLRERWPSRLLAVGDRCLAPTLRAALPDGVEVEWRFDAWQPPAPFAEWYPDVASASSAAETSSLGCGMLVVVSEAEAPRWLGLCAAWNEPATPIARLVAGPGRAARATAH